MKTLGCIRVNKQNFRLPKGSRKGRTVWGISEADHQTERRLEIEIIFPATENNTCDFAGFSGPTSFK